MSFPDITIEELNNLIAQSWKAFSIFKRVPLKERAAFMRTIGLELEALGDELIQTAMKETHLPEARLKMERSRTIFQLTNYAAACEKGEWLEARIDTADPARNPPKPDVRKMVVPLGPVGVFGASNFPFAYSTAGGDTACAFAAGCPVIVKAHPAHAQTSHMVAGAIHKAVKHHGLPAGVFTHVHGASFEVGKALVTHPFVKAIGFTGSFKGGKALFDWANGRKEPIPVFAEMGSINPVFLFPHKLKEEGEAVAKSYAASITLGVGQFCTNPGLLIVIESERLQPFITALNTEIVKAVPGKMLHEGIGKAYTEKRKLALSQPSVETVAVSEVVMEEYHGLPTIASATAGAFLENPVLHEEVFGPYSLIVKCKDKEEMKKVVQKLQGQLTATVLATDEDVKEHEELMEEVKNICGRFIYNGMPTGVEVCLSMHHGGPYPATTDSRFTSVGADGIKRFARPLCFQGWPNSMLPDELKNENPLGIWRTINNELSQTAVS